MPEDEHPSRVARELFLQGFFGSKPPKGVASRLAEVMDDLFLGAGEVVYRVGEPSEYEYIIVSGEVELELAGQAPWRFGAASLIGAADVLNDRPYSRTAVTLSDAHLLRMRGEEWFDALEDNFEFARGGLLAVAGGIEKLRPSLGPHGGFEVSVPSEGPTLPREPLNLVERILALREAPLFRSAGLQPVAELATVVAEVRLDANERLFSKGEPPRALFVVAHGHVDIEREEPPLRASFGAGSVVGGASALAAQGDYTAVAAVPTVALRISLGDYFDTLEEHFDAVRSAFIALNLEREQLRLRSSRPPAVAGPSPAG